MAYSVNRATLLGTVGENIKYEDEKGSVFFQICTTENVYDKQTKTSKKEFTWNNVIAYDYYAKTCRERCLKKGDKVFVDGAMKTRKVKDGYFCFVDISGFTGVLDIINSKDEDSPRPAATQAKPQSTYKPAAVTEVSENMDDVPF